jgi:hypothetical protein
MGAAASTAVLNKDQKELIAQKLKKLYDENVAETVDSETLSKILSTEYVKLSESFLRLHIDTVSQKESTTSRSTNSTPHSRLPTKSSFNVPTPTSAKSAKTSTTKSGRRRSFDLSSKDLNSKSESAFKQLADAAAAAANDDATKSTDAVGILTENIADSWDSVSQQPYCDICKMAFKSAAFLDRHIKFSSLHADNVRRATEVVSVLMSPPKKELISLEEGLHYRLLYSGSKFFWRSQETVDFDLYHHFLAHTIEIIPFNASTERETSRIYCDYEAVLEAVQASVQEELNNRCEEMKRVRFAETPDRDKLHDEILLQKIVTYCLQRLQFVDQEAHFLPGFADDPDHLPVLDKRPVVLVPVVITRRRRSSVEEIQETMTNIRSDCKAIGASVEKAKQLTSSDLNEMAASDKMEYSMKIAHLVYDAAGFMAAKAWYHQKSLPLRRFHRVIDLVVRKRLVEKTRGLLDAKGLNVPTGLPRKRSILTSPVKTIK